jgi:hypothetical protein
MSENEIDEYWTRQTELDSVCSTGFAPTSASITIKYRRRPVNGAIRRQEAT